MQDRGLAAYIAELIGTFFLVFTVGVVVTLFVATTPDAAQGSDFAVVGLVHAFVLFGLILTFGAASGGHFNPAVTIAAAALRRIDPLDAVVYILAQLSGGVLGALARQGPAARRGPALPLRGGDDQPAARRRLRRDAHRGDRHLPARARGLRRGVQPPRAPGVGAARDRHHAGLRRDVLRPAHRRLVQPGPLVRPGADRRRVRRHLALPARPAPRRAARGSRSTGS